MAEGRAKRAQSHAGRRCGEGIDVIMILAPDEAQAAIYRQEIAPT